MNTEAITAPFDLDKLLTTSLGGFTLGHILSAALLLLVCLLVIRVVLRLLGRILSRSKLSVQLRQYVAMAVKAVLYVLTVIMVTGALGVDMTSLVALLSVGSLGITLAAEDVLSNVAGGLVLLSARPFAIGDYIEAGGAAGTVREITLNHTKLETVDGLLVMLPNKELSGSKVINYTALGRRRIARKITASYDAPTETVKAACLEALEAVGTRLLPSPAPAVELTDYGESAIEYTIFCWTTPEDFLPAGFALGAALRDAFDRHGVEMTYNHLNVHIMEK